MKAIHPGVLPWAGLQRSHHLDIEAAAQACQLSIRGFSWHHQASLRADFLTGILAHQVKTLVDDFILELKKVRALLQMPAAG